MASVYRLEATNYVLSARVLAGSFEGGLDRSPAHATAVPYYYLVSHAAELFLKSALLKRGLSEEQLRAPAHRHSLASLLELLQAKGVSVSPSAIDMIQGLHPQHQRHVLRYSALVEGEKVFLPFPSAVFSVLDELLLLTRISTQGV
jgi:hypothetical protein